jgi:hypothetical protein
VLGSMPGAGRRRLATAHWPRRVAQWGHGRGFSRLSVLCERWAGQPNREVRRAMARRRPSPFEVVHVSARCRAVGSRAEAISRAWCDVRSVPGLGDVGRSGRKLVEGARRDTSGEHAGQLSNRLDAAHLPSARRGVDSVTHSGSDRCVPTVSRGGRRWCGDRGEGARGSLRSLSLRGSSRVDRCQPCAGRTKAKATA